MIRLTFGEICSAVSQFCSRRATDEGNEKGSATFADHFFHVTKCTHKIWRTASDFRQFIVSSCFIRNIINDTYRALNPHPRRSLFISSTKFARFAGKLFRHTHTHSARKRRIVSFAARRNETGRASHANNYNGHILIEFST